MIDDKTTLAELRALPSAEVIGALWPEAKAATSRRYGPFGNIWIRPIDFQGAGSILKGHKHNYDHVTWLSRGAVMVRYTTAEGDRAERIYIAPAAILIKRGIEHEITALEDGTQADCIYALRDLQSGEVIDHWDGGMEAYS